MSHTTETAGGTVFVHNGDYSGKVTVRAAEGMALDDGRHELTVPFSDLRALVLDHLRKRMISGLESASDDTLEAMLTNGTGVSW